MKTRTKVTMGFVVAGPIAVAGMAATYIYIIRDDYVKGPIWRELSGAQQYYVTATATTPAVCLPCDLLISITWEKGKDEQVRVTIVDTSSGQAQRRYPADGLWRDVPMKRDHTGPCEEIRCAGATVYVQVDPNGWVSGDSVAFRLSLVT